MCAQKLTNYVICLFKYEGVPRHLDQERKALREVLDSTVLAPYMYLVNLINTVYHKCPSTIQKLQSKDECTKIKRLCDLFIQIRTGTTSPGS